MHSIDLHLLQKYREGTLDKKTMHEIEKQALEDPFLADAMEGLAYTKQPLNSQLSILQRQLETRIAQQQENKNTFYFTWQRLSVAFAAAVIFIAAGILFWMKISQNHPQNATQATLTVETTIENEAKNIQPVKGWTNFEQYLQKNLQSISATEKPKTILIQFTINKENSKAQNIKIIQGVNTKLDNEIIELLRNGPRWDAKNLKDKSLIQLSVNLNP